MKLLRSIGVLALLGCGALASFSASAAQCYVVYDRNEQVVYRDLRSPIDLSRAIGPQVQAKWSGGALVIVGDSQKCIPMENIDSAASATNNAPVGVENGATSPEGETKKAPAKSKRKAKKAEA